MEVLPEHVENLKLYYCQGEELLVMERVGDGAYCYTIEGIFVYLDDINSGYLEDILYDWLSVQGLNNISHAIENLEKDKNNYLKENIK